MPLKTLLMSTRAARSILAASSLRPALWTAAARSQLARLSLRWHEAFSALHPPANTTIPLPDARPSPQVERNDSFAAINARVDAPINNNDCYWPNMTVFRAARTFESIVAARVVLTHPHVHWLSNLFDLRRQGLLPSGMPPNTPEIVDQLMESKARFCKERGPVHMLWAFGDAEDDEAATASKKYIVEYLTKFYQENSLPFGAMLLGQLNFSKDSGLLVLHPWNQ
eukprot:m.920203 g.920203  ORF g.920203 m.920203 type:complete len:225 (+) comp62027_c0_seq1:95-769(+)